MEEFAIKFFDGRSSALHEGRLILHANNWEIKLADEGGVYNTIFWDLSQINQPDFVGGSNIFKYGDFPQQTLECANPNLKGILRAKYPHLKFFGSASSWAISTSLGLISLIALGIVFLGFVFYKYALPPIAEAFAEKVPMEYEQKWGDSMLKNIIDPEKKMGDLSFEKNENMSKISNNFARNIDFRSPYKINITVVKSDQVNAFALPGGNVVVFDALLKKMTTKEQFAALLGHEVAHVNRKHSLKNIFRSLSGYLFISLITSDINGISTVLFENANSIYNLSYSRKLEAEADTYSVKTMQQNKLDTKGLFDLFSILESASKLEPYEILSSHPLTRDRKAFAKKFIIQGKTYTQNEALENIWKQLQK
jgi:beta-barrel assembly-enhancing protease